MTDLHADAANGEVVPAPGASTAGAVTTFSLGDPMPVLDSRGLLDYLECCRNGRCYEPPIFLSGLSRTTRSNPFLHSGLIFKRNMLVRTFVPHRLLERTAFSQLALDYLVFGMAYLGHQISHSGRLLQLHPLMAQYMRRGVQPVEFFQVRAAHPPAAAGYLPAKCGWIRFDSGCGHGLGVDGTGTSSIAHGHGQRVAQRGGHYFRAL